MPQKSLSMTLLTTQYVFNTHRNTESLYRHRQYSALLKVYTNSLEPPLLKFRNQGCCFFLYLRSSDYKTKGPLVLYCSPCIAHLNAEDMLKSAVIEEKKFKNIESEQLDKGQ